MWRALALLGLWAAQSLGAAVPPLPPPVLQCQTAVHPLDVSPIRSP